MKSLAVDRLVKRFGERSLLDLGKLEFPAGELHVVIGDNGAGKTTFLKILAGLEHADEFSLHLNGDVYSHRHYPDALRREVVYVHQHPYLFSSSIQANIEYGLRIRGREAADRERMVREAMTWAGLTGVASVSPRKLSGGEKQRVALARALVLAAPVMLIDEPTASLDAKARGQVITLLESLRAEGRIVIIATHDQALLKLPGATIWSLSAGQIGRAQ